MKPRLSGTWRGNSGQSLVELALVLPLLVYLALGIYDFSRAIQANNIIVNMSREGANLALRTTSIAHQDIMNSLASTAQWLTKNSNGKMYLTMYMTTVQQVKGNLKLQSQEAWQGNANGPDSQISKHNVANYLGNITIPEGSYAYIYEVAYTYNCLFLPLYAPQMHSTAIF